MVDVEKLANRLAELASAPEAKRKKIAIIRDLFDGITTAMSRGVSLDDIVRELRNDGIEIDKRGLSVTLSKIRVERGELKAPRKRKQNYLGSGAVNPPTVEAKATAQVVDAQAHQPVKAPLTDPATKPASGISGAALFGERPAPGLRPANLEIDQDGDPK